MKKVFAKNTNVCLGSFVALVVLTIGMAAGCQKQEKPLSSNLQQALSSTQTSTSTATATSSTMSKQEAVDQLNSYFTNLFYPVDPTQVQRVSKQQFVQWLRGTKVAAAEQTYLGTLLSSDGGEFLLLRNVTLRETGKQANMALIAVPPSLFKKYTQLVAVADLNTQLPNGFCSWKRCDYAQPCPCYSFLSNKYGPDCPGDRCSAQTDCQGFQAQDCDQELVKDQIDNFEYQQ